ncbi:MAG: DUF4838 domain-containing protein [Clostridiales bacterium]|nr:DUF4838 domain-containing protein [Clostridiales bacterium]
MRKIVLSVLIMALLSVAAMTGCSSRADTETAVTEPEIAVPEGWSCTIVRGDTSSDAVIKAAMELRRILLDAGIDAALTTDWVNRGEEVVKFENEITIGATNRPESEELYARMAGAMDDYIIMIGDPMYIAATDESASEAAGIFAGEYLRWLSSGAETGGETKEMERQHVFDRKLLIGGSEFVTASVRTGATSPEKYAGEELKKYLRGIGIWEGDGAEFEISADPSVGRDGYSISVSDGTVHIRGGNGRGVIYGVYAFLERYCGVRFFMPGIETLGSGDITVNEGCSFTPIFEMRQSDWQCGNSSVDWCLKRGVNQREIPDSQGGHIRYGGFVHTMTSLADVPGDKQPCFSDPEVLAKVIGNVRSMLEADPSISIVSVSQNDNQNYCRCEKCAAIDKEEGSHMGSLLRFVNAVAEDIEKDYPDVVIDTLAYQHTRKAPKITRPRDNVCIRLCSIECCFSHPLNDPDCPSNAAFAGDIVEWSKICDRIYIWDYVTCFSYYVPTFPNFGVLRQNMRFFAEHGVKGMYPEGNYNSPKSGEFGELRCYLLSKLMWDPMMSEEEYYAHMDEFLAAYYGEGWRGIRKYIDWTTEHAAGRDMNIWSPPFQYIPYADYKEMEETFDGYWDEAERLAGDRLDDVRRSRLQWKCIKLMLHPDAALAKEFLDELTERGVYWNEWSPLPKKYFLDESPAQWG